MSHSIAILNAMTQLLWNVTFMKAKVLVMMIIVITFSHANITWENWIQLDENYLLQWSVKDADITFEMHVRAHGYVGFGLSRDGTIYGADVFISWIDDGHMFYYDCHIKTHTQTNEPVVDTSQDYELLSGHKNATHTILRFRRKLNTCDDKSDVPITNDTMNIIFVYTDEKPKRGQFRSDNLPNLANAIHQIRSLLLLQRSPNFQNIIKNSSFDILDIRNSISNVTSHGLVKWCHSYRNIINNHHIVRYEPIFSSLESQNFINLMRIYECKSQLSDLRSTADFNGECSERTKLERKCFMTLALWTKGSDGFTFPNDVGYPLDAVTSDNFLLEIHYQDIPKDFQDSSGFRLFHTSERRKFDAGTISINIRPNFLHIIAPGYKRVVSIGHCTSNCTQKAFPDDGLNIFGITMQTHSAGTMVKVNFVRNGEELEPLAQDANLNSNYIETRLLNSTRKLYPGDHLMVECTYNSFKRERFTLGGESSNEEICMSNIMYYPRQEQLVACNSQSKISDVLRALGIEELGFIVGCWIIGLSYATTWKCEYRNMEEYDYFFGLDAHYACDLTSGEASATEITDIEGSHIDGFTDDDVKYVFFNDNLEKLSPIVCQKFKNVILLFFYKYGIKEVDGNVLELCKDLEKITFKNNELREFPINFIPENSKLTKFQFNQNYITALPENFFQNQTQLVDIDIHGNDFVTLPSNTFQKLVNLKKLNIAFSQLQVLDPEWFMDLINLVYLSLIESKIVAIPVGVFKPLVNLQELRLSGNRIQSISPSSFEGLEKLRVLILDENQIDILSPKSFDGLGNVKKLYLEDNKIVDLPAGVFVPLKNLEELRLRNNQLVTLHSDSFGIHSTFTYIGLEYNKINAFDEKLVDNTAISDMSINGNICISESLYDLGKNELKGALKNCTLNYQPRCKCN